MDDKTYYLTFHGYDLGTPEAEQAWRDKVEMMENPRRAPMAFVQRDICYDSPIDGRPITTKQARADDLKRNGCVEYDPGMRQDADRRRQDMDRSLDKTVDETVEREFSTMPARKREKLESELKAGVVADTVRLTPQRSA